MTIYFSFLSRFMEQEFMQNRFPVAGFPPGNSLGPSSKTCPKCEPHLAQVTSTLHMPKLSSSRNSIFLLDTASVKLGQPVLESNFASDQNNSLPQAAHLYIPFSLES